MTPGCTYPVTPCARPQAQPWGDPVSEARYWFCPPPGLDCRQRCEPISVPTSARAPARDWKWLVFLLWLMLRRSLFSPPGAEACTGECRPPAHTAVQAPPPLSSVVITPADTATYPLVFTPASVTGYKNPTSTCPELPLSTTRERKVRRASPLPWGTGPTFSFLDDPTVKPWLRLASSQVLRVSIKNANPTYTWVAKPMGCGRFLSALVVEVHPVGCGT